MRTIPLVLAAILALPGHAAAATFTIVNTDAAGVGFNDPTPVAPAPGNPGTTLGQQRMNVMVAAATRWGKQLISNVQIRVEAKFEAMQCSPAFAWYAFAGPKWINYNFANAPRPNTWYPTALASALSGTDLAAGDGHIQVRFNLSLDTACMGAGTGWWYALTPTALPNGRVSMLTTALHELGHGLGVLTYVTEQGAYYDGRPDAYNWFSYDVSTNKLWTAMNNSERAQSTLNDPNLVWTGSNANAAVAAVLRRPARLTIGTPAAIAGNYDAAFATFGNAVPESGLSGTIAAAIPADGCAPLTNPAAIAGRIALIDRGTCIFTDKTRHATAAGAIGVLIAGTAATPNPIHAGGYDPAATAPTYSIGLTTANAIRAQLGVGVQATMTYNLAAPRLGTTQNQLRLHAPNPYVSGSSVSHVSSDALPAPLMVPYISPSNPGRLDLTPALLRDIGWSIDPIFSSGFDSTD